MNRAVYILTLFFLLPLNLSSKNTDKIIYAKRGILDLRFVNIDTFPPLPLKGEWEFYWNKLLGPEDFHPQIYVADAYAEVPKYWSQIRVDGKNIVDTGYATYRLIILTNSKNKVLRIYFPSPNSSAKIWWNGQLLGEIGNPKKSGYGYKPGINSIVSDVNAGYRNEIIVQLANYSHREGGFFVAPRFGDKKSILRFINILLIISALLLGVALIMALYNFFLFFLYQKNYAVLSFFVFTLLLGLRVFIVNNDFVSAVLPNMSFTLKYRIEYFTFFFIPPALFFYLYYVLIKDKLVRVSLFGTMIIAILFSLTMLFPSLLFTKTMPYYQLVYLYTFLISIYLIIKHIKLKTSGIVILGTTILLMFIFAINDILMYLRIIESVSLMPAITFSLILGQSLVLSKIFSDIYKQNARLRRDLEFKNIHLEELVKQRTKDLELKSRKLEKQNKYLRYQQKQLELKDYIITSSLKYASDIQEAIMPNFSRIGKYYDYFLLFMPRDIVSGDGFWFSDKHSKYFFVVLFDATGHGVPAAFITIIATYLLNTLIDDKKIEEPNEILENLDLEMKKILEKPGTEGIDAVVVRIDRNKQEPSIKFSGAKLDFFYFNSKTKLITRYRGIRRSIGYAHITRNTSKFTNTIITFHKYDIFYLLTDGYIEQSNQDKQRFGTKSLIEFLQKIGSEPMRDQELILKENLIEFMGDEKQKDDITIIGIKNSLS